MTPDRIEKQVLLRAPRQRVWEAISDSKQFGYWFAIERIEPPRLFSFRWHPFVVEPGRDYSAEPTTLVEFRRQAVLIRKYLELDPPSAAGT